ncbi:MAG: primosomal protein N' [Chloroflexi bacterium]|nr:primosomal protein N' [Chloroflexota bacterium]
MTPVSKYAEVAVDSPYARRGTFSYSVPSGINLLVGHSVIVPFGKRTLPGIVVGLPAEPQVAETRDICSLISPEPVLDQPRVQLALWMSTNYLAPLYSCLSLMLPPGAGLKPKTSRTVSLAIGFEEAERRLEGRAGKGLAVIGVLADAPAGYTVSALARQAGVSAGVVHGLIEKGLLKSEEKPLIRDPLSGQDFPALPPPVLMADQLLVWQRLEAHLSSSEDAKIFLLHGVTGSGKTELYLRTLEKVISLGRKGIVLVPEISLTPQTISRFCSRFPGKVAVLHSRLSPGERRDEWRRIAGGEFDVVIGPRSALFAPQPRLGLIVLDEEHEWSYKQQEQPPRYHARDVARKMSQLMQANVLLGSATPDVSTYLDTEHGKIELLQLPQRIPSRGVARLPEVQVVDMREQLKSGNRSIFSRPLHAAMGDVLSHGYQSILFLNRRGTSTIVMCRDCGHVVRCRRCEVSLTFHVGQASYVRPKWMPGQKLVCHQCNTAYPLPMACPACMSRKIKFMGTGTEKVEDLLHLEFPEARILRWDRDTTLKRRSEQEIFTRFLSGRADILLGTQMIAKGLDMPRVTLVGVINADVGMFLPDFRSGERTFQLLCQVAGRAGRGEAEGRVIIQTYNPDHYAVKAAALHDYQSFYAQEKSTRAALGQPPFSKMVKLVFSHSSETRCKEQVEKTADAIRSTLREQGISGLEIIGPAPSFLSRLRGKYRWQLLLRGREPASILQEMNFRQGWTIDVDPVSVL